MEAAGFNVTLQPFEADIFFERVRPRSSGVAGPVVYPRYDGENGVWYTADFSGDGDVDGRGGRRSTSPSRPTRPAPRDSGCEAADFGPRSSGKVVLLQRGTCDFGLKAEIAGEAGAVGGGDLQRGHHRRRRPQRRADPDAGRLRRHHPGRRHRLRHGPRAGATSPAAGRTVTLRVKVDGFVNAGRADDNVIAETPGGRADRTVVVGGHLDSVYEGPGINDDGSGVSMMIETAEADGRARHRPAEQGAVHLLQRRGAGPARLGVLRLPAVARRQIKDISVMLDFDMLASRNYARFIYDGNGDEQGFAGPNGSGVVEQVFKDFWDSQGLAYETIPFDGRSDYDAFTDRRDPGRWHLRRRRGAQDSRPGRAVRRHRRRAPSTRATTSRATPWPTSTSRA